MKIKPMLAHKFDKSKVDFSNGVYMQPKLDGVRCLFTEHGAYSRTGKKFMNVKHIEEALQPLFDNSPHIILDGELYNHKLKDDFEKIISLVRKQKPTDEDRIDAQNLVQLHVYDYIDGNYSEYATRRWNLDSDLTDIYSDHVKHVQSVLAMNLTEAKAVHEKFMDLGYEGSILRTPKGIYKHGRSYDLMKFKDFSDTEATIVDYVSGKGKRTGTIGKFIMIDDKGVKFGCPPGKGYSYKDLANMLKNIDTFIGKRATFTYFQRTKAGSYRHPLFKAVRDYE